MGGQTQGYAEESLDSLYREVSNQQQVDSQIANRIMLLLDAEGVTDSLIRFDRNTSDEKILEQLHFNMSLYYYDVVSQMTAALQAARRAESYARNECDTSIIIEALAMQAVAASRMGQLETALAAAREEMRFDSIMCDASNMARTFNILAGLSLQADRLDDAKKYINKAIEVERSLPDSSALSIRYGLAAEIYTKCGELGRALDYAQRAYELDRVAGDDVKTARRLAQMADIYAAQDDGNHAESLYLRAIEMLRTAGEQKSLAITLKQVGSLYLKKGRNREALNALGECESICRTTHNRFILQKVLKLLSEAYEKTAPQEALACLREAFLLNDSLHSEKAEQMANEIRLLRDGDLKSETPHPSKPFLTFSNVILFIQFIIAIAFGILLGMRSGRRKEEKRAEEPAPDADSTEQGEEAPSYAARDLEFLAKVSEVYERSLERHRMGIDELASEMCMSRSQFTRRILSATGTSANTYFNRLRLEKATRLLKDSDKPIGTIAYECGFDDAAYFCNLFKKFYNVTPMQYRIIPTKEAEH
ncbi:MAG: helix-turn-helix domain-containing protein [Bacteroidaceae bacterium]|nr:helix-turn-helix domain-containing protein [Bacteroidaceae bacterium]